MTTNEIQVLISMVLYMLCIISIGLFFMKKANKNSENYFLGGRSLGPWVAAMSAEASDMSGWLLMGLPGVAYFSGVADAAWTAIGLAAGTYINWLIVAKRLRRYSAVANDAITIPDFFSFRYHEEKKIIMMIASLFILIFFTVYAASCFVTCGKLFSKLFGASYHSMMILGALFVIIYTFLGGFLAESASDFIQAVVMICALSTVLILGTVNAGGVTAVISNAQNIEGFFSFFTTASPSLNPDGVQQVSDGIALFGPPAAYGFLTIISTMSWGLGYFGMPQVLLRFMAIRKVEELKKSRRIATTWVLISLFCAVSIGVIGRVLYPTEEALLTSSGAESVFVVLSQSMLPPLLAGIVMAGILAATISSSDSYLLIAASAFSKNIYQSIIKKDATDKQVMKISRIILIVISVIGIIIALDETSIIFKVVSFAWAGFGATFGPLLLFSLFWKRTTREGAVAGMLSGGIMVFFWNLVVKPFGKSLGGPFGEVLGIYELLPAFLISCLFIIVFSLMSKQPSDEIIKEFELAKAQSRG